MTAAEFLSRLVAMLDAAGIPNMLAGSFASALERLFSREEFGRRVPATVLGVALFVASAEDTILAKLEWAAHTDSERQLMDVAGILRVKQAALDREYIDRWARALGVVDLWQRVSKSDPSS